MRTWGTLRVSLLSRYRLKRCLLADRDVNKFESGYGIRRCIGAIGGREDAVA